MNSSADPSSQAPPPPRAGLPGWVIALIIAVASIPVVIALVGVLAALGIYGVRKNLVAAKSAEAKASIGRMARDAVAAYDREQPGANLLDSAPVLHKLCASSSVSVPDSASKIQGRKYMSSPSEWQVDAPLNAGFACLRFSVAEPQYYMYTYTMTGSGEDGSSFSAIANGDLDGDGTTSEFVLSGRVSGNSVNVATMFAETLPEE